MLPDNALTEDAAAHFLGVSPSFLAKRRCYGDGPAFVKYGGKRIVYLHADLEAYRLANRCSSDEPPRAVPDNAP